MFFHRQQFKNHSQGFGIYDLGEFLNVLDLVDGAHLSFESDYVTIGDKTGRSAVKYYYSDRHVDFIW